MWQGFIVKDYILIAAGLWLVALTVYVVRAAGRYKKLTTGTNKKNLGDILESLINKEGDLSKKVREITENMIKQQNLELNHLQKQALIRFNPFEDAGGDQSFVIALLDGRDNGFVISSLHARGNTRVYAKAVIGGKSQTHQFSKEEKEAVEKALRQTKAQA